MNFDDFQQAWQAASAQSRLRIDADLLIPELRRKQGQFESMIWARDMREFVVALIMIPVWLFLGWGRSLPWTWFLEVPGLMFVAAFMVVDRFRYSHRPPEPDASTHDLIAHSLAQVEHQIWLLRNVFWWYILPLALPCVAFFAHIAWKMHAVGWEGVLAMLITVSIFGSIMGFVYLLNQKAVRCTLEPRRQELENLLLSLGVESES